MHHSTLRFAFVLLISVMLMACTETTDSNMQTDSIVANYYAEEHRPQIHFSPQSHWMNDPNGMVYYEGEYHLFYQHYPDSNVWGPMHWGHAISRDLVHWEHLPIALYPDEIGDIFSGSAVVDWNNTSGLAPDGEVPLIAIYTSHLMAGEKAGRIDFQTQSIAFSLDKGRTWTPYEGNPVIPNPGIKDFRDPKVFWHEETEKWIMIFAAGDRVKLYNSPNLINWEYLSDFGENQGSHGGVWECPDLFPLEVDGETKWVMLLSLGRGGLNGGSATTYFIGDFDGKTFSNDNSPETVLWLDPGRDNYAGVTWSDIPKEDGRRLFMGWMSNWLYAQVVPTYIWRSAMTIPRSLSLKNTSEGIRLTSQPAKELESLRGNVNTISAKEIHGTNDITEESGFKDEPTELELTFEFDPSNSDEFGVKLSNSKNQEVIIGYNPTAKTFFVDRTNSGKIDFSDEFPSKDEAPFTASGKLKMTLFIDVSSVEVFVEDGELVMTEIFFPEEAYNQMNLFGKNVKLSKGLAYPLKGIWVGNPKN